MASGASEPERAVDGSRRAGASGAGRLGWAWLGRGGWCGGVGGHGWLPGADRSACLTSLRATSSVAQLGKCNDMTRRIAQLHGPQVIGPEIGLHSLAAEQFEGPSWPCGLRSVVRRGLACVARVLGRRRCRGTRGAWRAWREHGARCRVRGDGLLCEARLRLDLPACDGGGEAPALAGRACEECNSAGRLGRELQSPGSHAVDAVHIRDDRGNGAIAQRGFGSPDGLGDIGRVNKE